ncbi:MAG: hypothetical protein L0322_29080 [Chloroflexi bacterium]|nr:hypothetical protein [Chloroflexota bacterium]
MAAAEVTDFLERAWPQTVVVHNVEEMPVYQEHDVDLLWTVVDRAGRMRVIPIEVKGDRYHQTGNFFFETISNESRGTPGCFMYTKAKWLFYYFVEIGRLYCLPVARVRPWFCHQMERFEERRTSTPVGQDEVYVTIGRLVPIQAVLEEVEGVLHFVKEDGQWRREHREHGEDTESHREGTK